MKNSQLLFVLLLIVLSFSTLAGAQETAAPEIFFKEKTYVADKVMEGDIIEHTYTVFNKGNAVLNISSVKPG